MEILLIDDNDADRNLIKTYINKAKANGDKKSLNITIDESPNLKKGFEKIIKKNFDVILLDLGLPESKGIKTITKTMDFLKKTNKKIPIIILTSFEDYSIGKEAFSLGVEDFLIKDDTKTKDIIRSLTFATYCTHVKI